MKRLEKLTLESTDLVNQIQQRCELVKKLNVELNRVDVEMKEAESINVKLKNQIEEFQVPPVIIV